MDLAPAMPPAQDTYPVLVSSNSVSTEPVVYTVGPSLKPLTPAIMASISGLKQTPVSSNFLTSTHLSRSFNFVGRAFRSAKFLGLSNRTLYSSAVPIRWGESDSWQSKAQAADIDVEQVSVSPQVAQIENNYWSAAFVEQCMPDAQRNMVNGVRYRISLGDKTLGYVANEDRAYLLAQQLKRLIHQGTFLPSAIAPQPAPTHKEAVTQRLENPLAVGTAHQTLFTIDDAMAEDLGYSKEWAAVAWANNLRSALSSDPLSVGEAHMAFQGLVPSDMSMSGDASWYGPYFHGRATANGETYDQNELTVAHKSLPFGTRLKVRNLTNGKTVVVRVNDRGPYVGDRILDLSKAAADCLGSNEAGVIPVEATVLKKSRPLALSAK